MTKVSKTYLKCHKSRYSISNFFKITYFFSSSKVLQQQFSTCINFKNKNITVSFLFRNLDGMTMTQMSLVLTNFGIQIHIFFKLTELSPSMFKSAVFNFWIRWPQNASFFAAFIEILTWQKKQNVLLEVTGLCNQKRFLLKPSAKFFRSKSQLAVLCL